MHRKPYLLIYYKISFVLNIVYKYDYPSLYDLDSWFVDYVIGSMFLPGSFAHLFSPNKVDFNAESQKKLTSFM